MALNQVGLERLGTQVSKKIGASKNLIINGAMQCAQYGTSSTTNGYGSVDRFKILSDNTNELPTHAQVDLTSSDTGPYEEGFRKALKITNGNQTSGAGANDFIKAQQDIEGQNIVNSGWNATDPNSKLTFSYWVKSSVAQTFFGRFRAFASTQFEYTYSFALSANTWTKVTETVPGNSNFSSIPNTNAQGFFHIWQCFFGTDFTNNKTLDTWAVKDNANKSPDMTSTWYTTNDATFEITGVQLEVGSVATDFEHRTFGQELELCQRYYYNHAAGTGMGGNNGETTISENATMYQAQNMFCSIKFPTQMRTKPTLEIVTGTNYYSSFSDGSHRGNFTGSNTSLNSATSTNIAAINNSDTGSSTSGHTAIWRTNNAAAKVAFSAEL